MIKTFIPGEFQEPQIIIICIEAAKCDATSLLTNWVTDIQAVQICKCQEKDIGTDKYAFQFGN